MSHPALRLTLVGLLALLAIFARSQGLGLSLWLDEAWVANSVLSPDWSGVFHYERWLQTSPPLFLLLVRFSTSLFGLSNESLRLVPFLLSCAAGLSFYLLLMEFLGPRRPLLLPLAFGIFVLSPQSVEYGYALKQYSGELAVAATLCWLSLRYSRQPSPLRFRILCAATLVGLCLAYSTAFLLPGILLLCAPRWRHVLLLAAPALAILACLYWAFILPNSGPALQQHWARDYAGLSLSSALLLQLRQLSVLFYYGSFFDQQPKFLFLLLPLLAAGLSLGGSRRRLLLSFCVLPLLLLLLAERLALYPLSPRTSLFLLPGLVLAFAATLWALSLRFPRLAAPIFGLATLALLVAAVPRTSPSAVEDMDSAVTYLYSRANPQDQVYVHASTAEAFRFYAHKLAWTDASVLWGKTAWPCCPRGLPFPRGQSNQSTLQADLAGKLHPTFSGRLWLLWTNRPEHWQWVGFDDRQPILDFLASRGCSEKPTSPFGNVGLRLFSCSAQK